MSLQTVIAELHNLQTEGAVTSYAIGGAVAATFYLEPLATIDVDVFVELHAEPGKIIVDPQPIFRLLAERGYQMEGEYVRIGEWPVQFLAPDGGLTAEAVAEAKTFDVGGIPARVFGPEHLAAIALQTGRAKDKARLLQFLEQNALDLPRFESILQKHELGAKWLNFQQLFLRDEP